MEGLIKNNKLIADFIGANKTSNCKDNEMFIPGQTICRIDTIELGKGHILKFHKSWDWLMPVIQKILNISFSDNGNSEDFYNIRDCIPDINHTYKAVVQFIEEYNKSENELS
jgi:hypothetical protein